MTSHQASLDKAANDAAYFLGMETGMSEADRRVVEGLRLISDVYVECGRDEALLTGFNRVLQRFVATRHLPRREADCFFLVGESGAGKSRAIERMLRDHPSLQPVMTSSGPAPRYVSIKLRGYTHPRLVGRQIIRAAGYGMDAKKGRGEVWDEMSGHLNAQGVCLVHIDEAQHLLTKNASQKERDDLGNAIKGVSIDTEWPVIFVFSGLPEVLELPVGDNQVERRGNFVRFPHLMMDDERDLVLEIINKMSRAVKIEADYLKDTDIPDRLARAASYQYARVCQLVEGALQEALEWKAERLTGGHFSTAYERRSLTDGLDERNMFLDEFWETLPPGSFLVEKKPPAQS